MSSLINTVRSKFLEAIRSVNPPGRWKILVVDEHSQRLIGSVLKQFDILEENVTLIESITSNREPQQFEAIYLVMSTSQNVDRIIRDFSNGQQQYSAAHLFFVDGLPEHLFERLTSSPAEPYLKALQELFINFWAIEGQAFTVRNPGSFFNIYSPPRSETSFKPMRDRLDEELRFMSKMISNVCLTLNEYPYVRYYLPSHHQPLGPLKPHASTRPPPPPEGSGRWRTNLARGDQARAYESVEGDYISKILAFMVQQNLDEYKKANPDFPKPSDPPRPRGTLIITDRAMDTMAPLLHEFTYQAMANDLLPIQDGTSYTYKFQTQTGLEDKTAALSDADSVWTELRHMHMREAIDKLMADFNQFLQDNAGFKGEGAANLNDMKDMLANLPQFQEQRDKFSLHLNMAQECMAIFERDKLPAVANVEQNCATGVTAEGKVPKTLVEEMVPLLDSRDVVNTNKVRIIALYIQHRDGVPDEDRRRLYQHARLTLAEQDAVNALVHLGVRISRVPGDKDTKKKIKQKPSNEEEYELSRYKPVLRTVLEEHVSNKLDPTLFPYVKDAPSAAPTTSSLRSAPQIQPAVSLRSQKPSWHKATRGAGTQNDNRQRILVFVAGGMTYSEMREAYLLSKSLNKEIIIGSTHALTPRQFVDDLKVLEMGGIGSKALPNGLVETTAPPRSAQEIYDQKYFTRDAPPPPRAAPAPTPKSGSGRLTRPSPAPSFGGSSASVNTNYSNSGSIGEEKKKKRGFLRF
ncbi:Sec1-like protein [Dichomitus squalens LYAD-421 SS1]|uniref:Sec1-like protein n=1 Tax=Dichomitus squalens (strain LYAD-421) TaxID=732165 RepID=R7STG6_DICSQ|nr:Sec1-like protein [Dichomitus squalens LYAD-421 SS1]EJF59045.1 Sec1-like protein [Dichomitus squalens LYAD-421 SS1]